MILFNLLQCMAQRLQLQKAGALILLCISKAKCWFCNFIFLGLTISILKMFQYFSVHCSCHLQGEWGSRRMWLIYRSSSRGQCRVAKCGAVHWNGIMWLITLHESGENRLHSVLIHLHGSICGRVWLFLWFLYWCSDRKCGQYHIHLTGATAWEHTY
jgi:hypothetical protein